MATLTYNVPHFVANCVCIISVIKIWNRNWHKRNRRIHFKRWFASLLRSLWSSFLEPKQWGINNSEMCFELLLINLPLDIFEFFISSNIETFISNSLSEISNNSYVTSKWFWPHWLRGVFPGDKDEWPLALFSMAIKILTKEHWKNH